ncbi:SAM and SH3 domain-containing protein [Tanacetum coccineum]
MEYMIRSFHKRGIQISHLFNIISTGANNLQHKWNQTKFTQTNTTETLNKFIFGFWDVYAKLLNHCPSSDNMQQKWNDINEQYKLTDNMQHKWNEFNEQHKLVDNIQQKWTQLNQQYKVTDNIGNIFKHFLTNVKNIIEHVLHSLNNMFPPETRNEQIRYLLKVAAVIVLSLGSVICMYTCLGFIFSFLFTLICYIVKLLFMFIICIIRILLWSVTSVVKVSVYPLTAVFRFVTVILRCVRQCLWFGGNVGVKMMKAPGKPTVMIARAVFEANPKQYFANLRGKV